MELRETTALSLFEKRSFIGALVLLVVGLFYNLGVQPLYLEEPRRAMIALEMIFSGNYWAPTQYGDFYYKKPALFNWVLIGFFKLFGSYEEWVCRIISPLSALIIGAQVFWLGKKTVSLRYGIYSAFLFLVSIEIFFYFSLTGEIDLFYAMLTFSSFVCLYHFYEKEKFYALFLSVYFLNSLGFLTKGFPSVIFLGASILAFFIYKKEIKKLLSLAHLLGIFVFLAPIAFYLYKYQQYNSLDALFEILWASSSERTVSGHSTLELLNNLWKFPLDLLKNILPAALLLPFAFQKDFFKKIKENKWIQFCCWIFLANIWIYWLSPGSRSRYTYMLYPLMINVLLYFYFEFQKQYPQWGNFLCYLNRFVLSMMIIAGVIINLGPALYYIPNILPASLFISVAGTIIAALFWNKKEYTLLALVLMLLTARIAFDATIPLQRAKDSKSQVNKRDAQKILSIVNGQKVHFYKETFCQQSTTFYLGAALNHPVTHMDSIIPGDFYIAADYDLYKGGNYQVFYEFDYNKKLIQFNAQ